MNIDKIIESPLINHAALAAKMFPEMKNAKQYLHKKINNQQRNKLNDNDREKILKILSELFA